MKNKANYIQAIVIGSVFHTLWENRNPEMK